jgi:hypothetical protein
MSARAPVNVGSSPNTARPREVSNNLVMQSLPDRK